MQSNKNEPLTRTLSIVAIVPSLFLWLIILYGLISPTFNQSLHPLDVGNDKTKRIVAEVTAVDSTNNGFALCYASIRDITPARFEEMYARPHIRDSLAALKREAPLYFGSMLMTDIFDFAKFAHRYHPDPDIVIHNIVVFGVEKMSLYVGPNPKIENPATYIDFQTMQGNLFIGQKEILRYLSTSEREYRYLHCFGAHKRSDTDEHFSHFSESDRLR